MADDDKEIWKDIEGYEGLYQVSNQGNIRNTKTGRVLKLTKNKQGYLTISLHKEKHIYTFRVSRLVAIAFLPNPDNKPCVDHINTIRTDNRAENLKWVTYKENSSNPITSQRVKLNSGRTIVDFGGKSIDQYTKQGEFIKHWDCVHNASKSLNIPEQYIYNSISHKNRKTAGGFVWKYAP